MVGTKTEAEVEQYCSAEAGGATGGSGIVSRCNNLRIYTLIDILYIFHTGMWSYLFVFIFRYLALNLYVNFLLDICILDSGSISICIHLYLYLNVDLFPQSPGAEATV